MDQIKKSKPTIANKKLIAIKSEKMPIIAFKRKTSHDLFCKRSILLRLRRIMAGGAWLIGMIGL
jgi:hypothetical protein